MPPKKDLDIEQIKELYEKLGALKKVGKIVGAGAETVRLRLLEANVAVKKRGRPVTEKEKVDVVKRVRRHRKKKRK